MKKSLLTLLLVLLASIFLFAACDDNGGEKEPADSDNLVTITGVTFTDAEHGYDGTAKSIFIAGTLPEGVTVVYSGNGKTEAGTHTVTATLSGEGFKDLILTANLTINKATITGVAFTDAEHGYDGTAKSVFIAGTLPEGVTVSYSGNGKTEAGTYTVTATLSGNNYKTMIITATLKIKADLQSYIALAEELFNYIVKKPDPYEMLPSTLKIENKFDVNTTYAAYNFASFINISGIYNNGIGQQLESMYASVNQVNSILNQVTTYYSNITQVLVLYKTYIAGNAEDPTFFETTLLDGTFEVEISLTGDTVSLFVKIGTVTVETSAKKNADKTVDYAGYIKISQGNELRYEQTEGSIKIGVVALGLNRTLIEFSDDGEYTSGSIYVYFGTQIAGYDVNTTKRIEIRSNAYYTGIIGVDGDKYIGATANRNMEIYRNSDGMFIGSEILEETSVLGVSVTYNTVWIPLSMTTGVSNVKAISKGTTYTGNPYEIYINNSSAVFAAKTVGGLTTKRLSRRYDIELRKEYFYNYDQTTQSYTQVEILIPFLFVQEEQESTLFSDIKSENPGLTMNYSAGLTATDRAAITQNYAPMCEVFDEKKDAVNNDTVNDFVRPA